VDAFDFKMAPATFKSMLRGNLEQNVEYYNWGSLRQSMDHRADSDTDDWINPVRASPANHDRAGDDGNV
jgi:hypothetical protein